MTTQGASAPVKTPAVENLKPGILNPQIPQAYDVSTNYSWRDGPLAVQSSVQSLQQSSQSQIFAMSGLIWGNPEHNRAGLADSAIAAAQTVGSYLGVVKKPEPATTTYYVFIPLLHYPEYAAGLIKDDTYKNLLTEVVAGMDDSLAQGKGVQIQFTDTDHSTALHVAIIDDKNIMMQNLVAQFKGMQLAAICNVPSAMPVIPSPASSPSYEVLKNVGYVQLIYALALWQSRNKGIKISSIKYPFPNTLPPAPVATPAQSIPALGHALSKKIGQLIDAAQHYNKNTAATAGQTNNASSDWVKQAGILSSDTILAYSPTLLTDSKVEVVVSHFKGKITSILDEFNGYTQGYTIDVAPTLGGLGSTLKFGFTTSDTADAIKLTAERLDLFFSKLNQKVLQDTKKAVSPGVVIQSVVSAVCGETSGGEISGYSAILRSVPALQTSLRPRKGCGKKTCMVIHEPVSSSGTAMRLINFARKKCLYSNEQLKRKVLEGTVPNLTDTKGKVLCPQGPNYRGISLHFVVGLQQSFQTLPYEKCGRAHASSLNNKSIGIEFSACRSTGSGIKGFYGAYNATFPAVANFEQVWTIVKASAARSGIKIQNQFYLGGPTARVWTLGKLTSGAGKGVLAHRREKNTTHIDGLIPELYCLLRSDGISPTEAYKKARTACQMIAKDGFKPKINLQTMQWI